MNGMGPDGGLLEHLQVEHHKLNCTLSAIQHQIAEPAQSNTQLQESSDFLAALGALRAELLAHFAEEEIDGCLGEAAARCPSATAQLKAIMADHQALLHTVDDLIASAGDAELVSRRFHSLSQRLHAHETAETHLLQYALGSDALDYDVEGDD
jgi:hypothetical protein